MPLNFNEAYQHLEACFKDLSEDDGSIYLPNHFPKRTVDFVLIGMEPSLSRWGGRSKAEATERMAEGFKEISWSERIFKYRPSAGLLALHFSIRAYLCKDRDSFLLTDISKGAMLSRDASKQRFARYNRWFGLLKEEIALVAPKGKRITVGKGVQNYISLRQPDFPIATPIVHYSALNVAGWKKEILDKEGEFHRWAPTLTVQKIEQVLRQIMRDDGASQAIIEEQIGEVMQGIKLTDNIKRLIFGYKLKFEKLSKDGRITYALRLP